MGMPRQRVRCPKNHWMGAEASYCRSCGQTYKRTTDHRVLMSEILTGKRHNYRSASTRPDVARKIRRWWTPQRKKAARLRGLAFASDPEWRKKIALSVSGAMNPHWEHGRAQIPYGPGWGRVNRRLVRKRAGYRCEVCVKRKPLDTHHKDGSKDNHSPENLQALCRKCHKVAHAGLKKNKNRPY